MPTVCFCQGKINERTDHLPDSTYHDGWQCFEAPGVQPYWGGEKARDAPISFARNCRTANRHGEIRVCNAAGETEESIAFDERANSLRV
jgi:hypothetical protein